MEMLGLCHRDQADLAALGQGHIRIEHEGVIIGLGLAQRDKFAGARDIDRHIVRDRIHAVVGLDTVIAVERLERDRTDPDGFLGDEVHLARVG